MSTNYIQRLTPDQKEELIKLIEAGHEKFIKMADLRPLTWDDLTKPNDKADLSKVTDISNIWIKPDGKVMVLKTDWRHEIADLPYGQGEALVITHCYDIRYDKYEGYSTTFDDYGCIASDLTSDESEERQMSKIFRNFMAENFPKTDKDPGWQEKYDEWAAIKRQKAQDKANEIIAETEDDLVM